MSIVMHYLVPETDAAKPAIESQPGPELPELVQRTLGVKTFGTGGRFVPACGLPTDHASARPKAKDDSGFFDGHLHRGTNVTYAGVNCAACLASEIFKRDKQPHPGDKTPPSTVAADAYTAKPPVPPPPPPPAPPAPAAVAPCAGC